jgi:hypothetical protein
MMAAIRRFWENPEWVNSVKDYAVSFLSPSSITIAGTDARNLFPVGRKVRVSSSSANPAYAFVETSTYSDPDTTITLKDFDQTGTPPPELEVHTSADRIDAYFLGSDEANDHGIGPSAFGGGGGGGGVFVVPTADTRLGIQAAIDSAALTGGIVMLGDVTYTIDQKILVPTSMQIWGRGPGQTKLLLGTNADDHVFEVAADAEDVSFFNMTLDGNQSNQTAGVTGEDSYGINFLSNPSRIFIDRVQVQNFRGHGIAFTGAITGLSRRVYQVNISNCIIDTVGKNGIHVNDPNGLNAGISISDCHIRNFGDSGLAADSLDDASGIYIEGRSTLNNIVVEANSASPNAAFDGSCIRSAQTDVTGSPSLGGLRSQWSNIRIEGAQVGTVGISGINLGADYVSVTNLFVNLTGTGVKLPILIAGLGSGADDAEGCSISNATVLSNASGTTKSQTTSGSPNASFSNCKFLNGTQGLEIGGSGNVVSGCTFRGQTAALPALTFSSGISEGLATGCSFNTIANDAISLLSNDTTIEGCNFKTISGDAISVASDNSTIQGCKFKTIVGDAIVVTGAGNTNSILGNRFDSVTGLNINDGGVATKIGLNSPNESRKDIGISSVQNLSQAVAAEQAITEWTNIAFPYGANGSRRYRVTAHLVAEWGGNTGNDRSLYGDFRCHIGASGTASDTTFRIMEHNLFTGIGSGDDEHVMSSLEFSPFVVTPASGHKMTFGWRTTNQMSLTNGVFRVQVSNWENSGWTLGNNSLNGNQQTRQSVHTYQGSVFYAFGGRGVSSALTIELLDEA